MHRVAQNHKQTENKPQDDWSPSTANGVGVLEGRAGRKWRGPQIDRSNPFDSSPGPGADLPPETVPGSPRVEAQRRALLALRARLQGEVIDPAGTALGGCGIEQSCGSPDTADRAGEVVEQDLVLGLLGSAGDTLEKIGVALERIDEGAYGRCVECGAPIPAARLEAIPYATCCVPCAARQERAQPSKRMDGAAV